MKLSILASVSTLALLAATGAMAQSKSTVDQTGTGGQVGVTQSGDNASVVRQSGARGAVIVSQTFIGVAGDNADDTNESLVIQAADDARAEVTQTGEDHDSVLRQSEDAEGAFASVTQSGDDQDSQIRQRADADAEVIQSGAEGHTSEIDQAIGADGASADVMQSGDGIHLSTITQRGAGGEAMVAQSGDGLGSSLIVQSANAQGAVADVTQINTGDEGNESEIEQRAAGASATVAQTGDDHRSIVDQLRGSDDATVEVRQTGLNHTSNIIQEADATAEVTQTGRSGHFNRIEQYGGADGARAEVRQSGESLDGSDHDSDIEQRADADAFVDQSGNGEHESFIDQEVGSDGSTAFVIQTGDTTATSGLGGSESEITQSGRFSLVGVYQDGGNLDLDDPSQQSDVVQSAALSAAFVAQIGENNTGTITQDGRFNVAAIAQASVDIDQVMMGDFSGIGSPPVSGNTSTIEQSGSSNIAANLQAADGNTSTITQGEGSSGNLALVLQTGAGNTSTVTQSGTGNDAFVTQALAGSSSTVMQSGSNNTATVNQ